MRKLRILFAPQLVYIPDSEVTHDSGLVAGRHDAARVWLVLRKLRDFCQRSRATQSAKPLLSNTLFG
jgi:hypothetical protein